MNNSQKAIGALLVGLIGAAFISFVLQVVSGLSVTGLNSPVVWGAYIVNFTFFMGLGAGILMLLGLIQGNDAVTDSEKFFLSAAALFSFMLSGVLIILDLGRIDRFYYLAIYPQIKSPLFWDFICLNALLGISTVCSIFNLRQVMINNGLREYAILPERILHKVLTVKPDFKLNVSLLRVIGIAVAGSAALIYLVTTGVFVEMKAHPEWHSPVVSVMFLISAITSGSAFALIAGGAFRKLYPGGEKLTSLAVKLIVTFLSLDLVITLVRYTMNENSPLLDSGRMLFPYSFFISIILGNIVPLLMIWVFKKNDVVIYKIMPVLVLAAVVWKRAEIIIVPYFSRWLPFAPPAKYIPTLPELLIVAGVYSAGIILFIGLFSFVAVCSGEGSNSRRSVDV